MCGAIVRFVLMFLVVAVALLGYTLATSGFEAFVKLLGIMAVVFFASLVVVAIVLRFAVRFIGKKVLVAIEGMGNPTPRRIHLQPRDDDRWLNAAEMKAGIDDFTNLGFTQVGAFQVEEMPTISIMAWCHPAQGLYGILYESPSMSVWSDMVCYIDTAHGTKHYTYTNNKSRHAGNVDKPPHSIGIHAAGLSVRGLHQKLQAELPSAGRRMLAPENFVKTFEQAWADEIDWRNARGGPTEEEVRRVAKANGKEFTEEQLASARDQMTNRALGQLDESLQERYFAEHNIPEDRQEAMQLVIIHDKLRASDVKAKFSGMMDNMVDVNLPDLPPRQAFARVNESLPEGKRYKRVGQVESPIAADVYQAASK